jgi:DNA-directed RNA polymerase specialized sigma24 family protein
MVTKKKCLQRHKVLREAYRHLHEFEDFATHSIPEPSSGKYGQSGRTINAQNSGLRDTIEYKGIVLSLIDLKNALVEANLAPRKQEAFYLNVICDMKQRDVAEKMGITTVSVGQYVEQAMLQIADVYFKDETLEDLSVEKDT